MPRLLFDEQLSEHLVELLSDVFPDCLHVRRMGAGGAADMSVWRLAQENGCVLVTKDEDFQRLAILRGVPPAVVWIRAGNCSTETVAQLLREHSQEIGGLLETAGVAVLELG